MNTTNKNVKLAMLALIPALGIAAFAGSAFAADGTTTASTTGTVSSAMHAWGHRGGRKTRNNTQFATDLASVLGLSPTDVKAKLDAGQTPASIITASGKTVSDVMTQLKTLRLANMKAKLDAKVAAGTLTQAKEDKILANMQNGSGRGHMKGLRDNTQFATDLASVLGLSPTDVKAKLDAGQTPASIITASGKTVSDVQAALKTLRLNELKTKLTAEVSAGKLTQAQADAIIARETNETTTGFGFRGRMMGHMFSGNPGTTNTTTGTSTQ